MTTNAAVNPDEAERLSLLHGTQLLQSEGSVAFQSLTRLLAHILAAPATSINLIDSHRVWSLARSGISLRQISRHDAPCPQLLETRQATRVRDLAQDSRFQHLASSPALRGLVAYAGVPLRVEGHVLGTVCAFDTEARDWSDEAMAQLQDTAEAASALVHAALVAQRTRRSEERVRTASLAGSDWLWETDANGCLTWVSAGLLRHTGLDPANAIGMQASEIMSPRDDETRASWEHYLQARSRHEPFHNMIADRETPRGRITVSVSGQPIFDANGQFLGYRGASRNVTRQVLAEQAARRADHLLRKAIETFHMSVVITDRDGQIELANRQWRDTTGSAYDATEKHWPSVLRQMAERGHYPQAEGREDDFLSWRLGLRESDRAHEIRFRDQWLLVRDEPLDDGGTVHFAMDITERKIAADKLRVSEELYRAVAATISDGLLIVNLDGQVMALNPAASRILGLPPGSASWQDGLSTAIELLEDDLVTPLPRERWPLMLSMHTGERVVDVVVPARRADHEIVWLQMSANVIRVDRDTPPFAAMATFRDITRERLALQDLALSEERWKFALEGAGDGVWDWDMPSGCMYYSTRWKHMLGYEDHEIADTPEEYFLRVHPKDRDAVAQSTMFFVTEGTGVQQVELRLRHREGHYLNILSRGKVVSRSREGKALRVVGTHSDITLIKEAEKAKRQRALAEAASAAKSEFLSRMSHEIRTPLNAITGFAQLMRLQLGQASGDSPLRSYIDQILHAGQHLSGLVDDVLDLQQVEAGVLNLRPVPIALEEELVQCLSMLLPMAEQREISMSSFIEPGATALADRQRLRQVLMNVGSNAIKYNRHGGTVTVRVAPHDDDHLMLSLEDSGAGMTPDQLARLFQPFERLGRETSNVEGTGLGLIITRSLVESMGGHMDIVSQPGVGTRVNLVLPRAPIDSVTPEPMPRDPAHKAAAATAAADPLAISPVLNDLMSSAADQPALRVLYVEDNRINALLFAEALRPFPEIDLEVAEDGDAALATAKENPPHVLVLDAHLPGMSGFDVLVAMRQLPALADVPAYMCSADAMPDDIARAKQAGFAGYWTKPIDIVAVTTELCRLAHTRGRVAHNAAP